MISPSLICCCSLFSAAEASLCMKLFVVESFQVSPMQARTWSGLSVVIPSMVKRKSGRLTLIADTWKVISFEDHTVLSSRVSTSFFDMSWIRKVIGCLSIPPLGRSGSRLGRATVTFAAPVISLTADRRVLAMVLWFGLYLTSRSNGRARTFPVGRSSHDCSWVFSSPARSVAGSSSNISGIWLLVYLSCGCGGGLLVDFRW